METSTQSVEQLLQQVLSDLAELVAGIGPEQLDRPTPCTDFDVAALRGHLVTWVTQLAVAFDDPDGEGDRPDPTALELPSDAAGAAAAIRRAAARVHEAVSAGAAEGNVLFVSAPMPGQMLLRMMLWEYVTHGSDLARATGRPWTPPAAAVEGSLEFGPSMLTDEYRGPGKDFGPVVEVPEDASALDRLLGFSGRDPNWTPTG